MTKLEGLRDFTVEESKNLYDYFFNEIKTDRGRIEFLSGSWVDKIPDYTSQISNFSNIINLVNDITKKKPSFLEKILKVPRNFEGIVYSLANPYLLNNDAYNHNYMGRALLNKETGLKYKDLSPLLKKFFISINAEIILKINDAKGMDIDSVDAQFWVDSVVEASKRMSKITTFNYYDSCKMNLNIHVHLLNEKDVKWLEMVSTEDLTIQSNIYMLNGSNLLYRNIAQLALLNYEKIKEPESFKKLISLLPPEAILKPMENPYNCYKKTMFCYLASVGSLNDTSLNYFMNLSESDINNKKDLVLLDSVMKQNLGKFNNNISINYVGKFLSFMDENLLNLVFSGENQEELNNSSVNLERVDIDKVLENSNVWKNHPFVISWVIGEKIKKDSISNDECRDVDDNIIEKFKL